MELIDYAEFSLVAGPVSLPEPAYSFDDDDWESLEIYSPQEIADAILQVPGVVLVREALAGWKSWSARWSHEDRYIEFDVMACQIDDDESALDLAWGGSKFEIHRKVWH